MALAGKLRIPLAASSPTCRSTCSFESHFQLRIPLVADCRPAASAALNCPGGRYGNATNLTAATDCSACPDGSSCPTGAMLPEACGSGSYATAEWALCSRCAAGRFQPQAGQPRCETCPAGSMVAESGSTAPTACTAGSMQPAEGQSSCLYCEPGYSQRSKGSVSCGE